MRRVLQSLRGGARLKFGEDNMMITAAQQDTKQMVEYHKVKFGSALLLLALLRYLLPRNPSVSAFETYTDADADAV